MHNSELFEKEKRKYFSRILAQIEVKTPQEKTIFCCSKRLTNGKSFLSLQKKFFDEELQRSAGLASNKNFRNYSLFNLLFL
jgi:hypothetical protein